MKLKSLIMMMCFGLFLTFSNCEDEDDTTECLICESSNPDITIENEEICVGDDNGDGGTLSVEDLQAVKAIFDLSEDVTCNFN